MPRKKEKERCVDAKVKSYIKSCLRNLGYRDSGKTYRHVKYVLNSQQGLRVVTDKIDFERSDRQERSCKMLCMEGMIVVIIEGETCQLPVRIAVHPDYPNKAPFVFINESEELRLIRGQKHYQYGYLLLSMLVNWVPRHCDLKVLLPYLVEEYLSRRDIYEVLYNDTEETPPPPAETSVTIEVPGATSTDFDSPVEEDTEEKTVVPTQTTPSRKITHEKEITPVTTENEKLFDDADKTPIKTEIDAPAKPRSTILTRDEVNNNDPREVDRYENDDILDLGLEKQKFKMEVINDVGMAAMSDAGCQTDQVFGGLGIGYTYESLVNGKPEIEKKTTFKIPKEVETQTFDDSVISNESTDHYELNNLTHDTNTYRDKSYALKGKTDERMKHVEYLDMRNGEITEEIKQNDQHDQKSEFTYATVHHRPPDKRVSFTKTPDDDRENEKPNDGRFFSDSPVILPNGTLGVKHGSPSLGSRQGSPSKSNVLMDVNENITMDNANRVRRSVNHGSRTEMSR